MVGQESAAFLVAELTKANDLRHGKSWSRQNDSGWTAVRWSDVRPDRIGQATSSAAEEIDDSGKSCVENYSAVGATDSEQHGWAE